MLESLAGETPDGGATGAQIVKTRELLGMSTRFFEVEAGCSHSGQTFPEDVCSGDLHSTVVCLDINPGSTGTVQDFLRRAIEDKQTAGGGVPRECPACGKQVHMKRRLGRKLPNMFFVKVGNVGLERDTFSLSRGVEHSHVVHCFRDEYCLCGVIYRSERDGNATYTCQMYLAHGWVTCSGVSGRGFTSAFDREFDDEFCRSTEDILMFVRTDVVERTFGPDVVERWPPPDPRDAFKVSASPNYRCIT